MDKKQYVITINGQSQTWDADKYERNASALKEKYPDSVVQEISGFGDDEQVRPDASYLITIGDQQQIWDGEKLNRNKAHLQQRYPDATIGSLNTISAPVQEDPSLYYPSPLTEEGRADYEPISREERARQEYDIPMQNTYDEGNDGGVQGPQRGFAAGVRESWKGLKAGFQSLWGETANLFSESSQDSVNALYELDKMIEEGRNVGEEVENAWTDVGRELRTGALEFLPGWMIKGLKNRVHDKADKQKILADIRNALSEAGGDVDKARYLLAQRAGETTYGDRQIAAAAEKFADVQETEGFGAWVGSNVVQMIPSASALIVGVLTKSPGAARAIGAIGMGGMTASTAGSSMYEARQAGANDTETWKVGVTDGMIEYITEKLPFDRYTSRILGKIKSNVANELFDALQTDKGTRKELEQLLISANDKLGGKLFSKKNLSEYLADMLAEGASEFSAEALQTMTSIMYEEPDNYPTIKEVLSNGWEGAKAGFFMGAVLGGASKTMEHSQHRSRRMEKGSVDIAQVDLGDGDTDVVEVVEYNPETNTAVILRDGAFETVDGGAIKEGYRFSYEEFENGRIQEVETEAINEGIVNDGQIRGMEETVQRDFDELRKYFTPDEINDIVSGKGISVNTGADAQAVVDKYLEDVRRLDDLTIAKAEQDQKRKDAVRDRIESEVGQRFWVQESGEDDGSGVVPVAETVEEVVYSDGRVGYVVGVDDAGNLTMVYNDGSRGFSTRAEIVEKENSGEILSNTVMGLDDYLAIKVDVEDVTSEATRMEQEQAANVQEVQAAHPVGSTINVGTAEAKVEVPIIAVSEDGAVVQMPDGTTPQLTWEDVAHAEGQDVKPKTNAELDQEIVDEYKVAYQPAVKTGQESSITQREVEVEQTTPANPLPLKTDGSVDQTALWNKNPERWTKWNDEQRQDGGSNSLAYVNGAIAKEQAKIAELQAAYEAESDFDARDILEKEIAETQARVERLTAIQQGYVAQAEAAAAPVVEAEPIVPRVAQQSQSVTSMENTPETQVESRPRERSVESEIARLYDLGLSDEEVVANLEAKIAKAQKALDAQSKKAPKMSADENAYIEKKREHQQKMQELQKELDFAIAASKTVNETLAQQSQVSEAPGTIVIEKDPEPQNAVEFAARELGLKEGGIKLQRQSFSEHTGYGPSEMKKFFGLFQSKQDGGLTIEKAGERLMEMDRENKTGFFDQNDPNAGLNAVLDALGAVKTIGELRSYVAHQRQVEAQRESDAAYSAMMAEYEATFGESVEDTAHYNLIMADELLRGKSLSEDEFNELNSKFAEEQNQYETRINQRETEPVSGTEDTGDLRSAESGVRGGNEESDSVLQREQSVRSSREGIPEGQNEPDGDSVYQQDADASVSSREQTSIPAVESSLDEDMPDFTSSASAYFPNETMRQKFSAMRARINDWAQKLGVQVSIMETLDDVVNQSAREQILQGRKVYGYFDPATGEVTFYLPDFLSLNGRELTEEDILSEIDKTYIHEVVSHRGIRGLLGEEKYGELCDMVWNALTENQKNRYLYYPGVNGNTRVAADEFIAHFAENVDYNDNRTLWDKIIDFIKGLFNSSELPVEISNESLADLLRRSYRNLSKSAAAIATNTNQQAEGNTMFRAADGSLVGMHNISEDKLRKVIKSGGSANPSTGVIDIERQTFNSYGEISLIMPSSLVDAKTGRNAGTFTADAWTPTYPQVTKRFSDDKLQRAYWRDISAIPEEMSHEVRMAFDSWLDDRNASGLAYMFLHERGEAPEMVRVDAKFPQEIKDKVSAILGENRSGLYELSDEEKQAVLDLYIQENFGGSREDFDKSIADHIQRIEDRLSTGKVPSFVEKRITLDLQWMKEHGYNYDNLSSFVNNIVSDIRHAGEVNDAATTNRALDYIKANGLEKEFDDWKESLNDRYGIKEYLFAGYTPSGNQRWLPNKVENASKLMNKEGLAGATGLAVSFNRFVATLAPKKKTLSDIRASKDRLVEDRKLVDDFGEKWSEVFFDLGVKCQPGANIYDDYGPARLTEAAQKKNPGAYLKKEYGVELSQEDLQRLDEMKKAIKTEFPANYFETKFQRPVYLNEFAAAVMPTTTSEDIKQAVSEAGLPIFEYDSAVEGSRKEATLKATEGEGIRFRTRITPEQDAAYMKAVEAGDMETAQRMVNEAARLAGYDSNSEYQGSLAFNGAAPSGYAYYDTKEERIEAWESGEYEDDQTLGDYKDAGIDISNLGWSLTSPVAQRMGNEYTRESIKNLADAINSDSRKIKVYRAVDADIKEDSVRNGDWVTPSRAYAEYHIGLQDWKEGRIIEQEVDIDDIWWDGNDINEWGYNDGKGYVYKNTQNNRKLLDPITYDDNGNVIPLSERFNPESRDIRFRTSEPITYNNFYKETAGVWEIINPSEVPSREADYTSSIFMRPDLVSSRYWYGSDEKGDYVIRESDHWSASLYGENSINDFIAKPLSRNYTPISSARWAIDMRNATEEGTYNKVKPEFFKDGKAYGKIYLSDLRKIEGIRFRASNENQAIFVSNAVKAVEGIKQEKATPEQWLKMIEKNGGLKAGEDKWMGLSDWLKASDKKILTKQEVLDFINENMIIIEEQHYSEDENALDGKRQEIQEALQGIFDEYVAESEDMNDDMFMKTHYDYAIQKLADELGYTAFNAPFINNNAIVELDFYEDDLDTLHELSNRLGLEKYDGTRDINDTRLSYTTEGLTDRHEIALTVPTIEPWNERDDIHFGDAGDGRAVAWIRFGDTTDDNGNRVLVIDEIQSKRHQEGRENGYADERIVKINKRLSELSEKTYGVGLSQEEYEERQRLREELNSMPVVSAHLNAEYDMRDYERLTPPSEFNEERYQELKAIYDQTGEALRRAQRGIPDAPFDKNWHELAMKRMLRYAAENGYDVIAWTKGEQQAERYNIGRVIDSIYYGDFNGNKMVRLTLFGAENQVVEVNPEGKVIAVHSGSMIQEGMSLADIVGKEIALKIMNNEGEKISDDDYKLSGEGLRVGGEGMKGFYDKMLPAFMNKYGKKWGVKVEDIALPGLEDGNLTMHSVPVTEEMKASVMEGLVMFRVRGENESAEDFFGNMVNEYQQKYNAVAPIEMVNPDSKEDLARYTGIPEDEITDDDVDFVKNEIESKNNLGGYSPDAKKVAIFVRESIKDGKKVELVLIHENIHAINDKYPDVLSLGEYLWKKVEEGSKEQRYKEEIKKAYPEDRWFNEMSAYIVSEHIQDGTLADLEYILDLENTNRLNKLLNIIGYGKERAAESSRRRGGNVLRQRLAGRLGKTAQRQRTATAGLTAEERRIIGEYFPGFYNPVEDARRNVNLNPSAAQKKAGNYKMGHIRLDGYNITIENPKGTVRRGTDSKGNAWENTLNNDYGYIRGTEGVDGDHIDVYLSDKPTEGNVFVIDQENPETREFDEHKVMYGFNSAEEAREAYLANFSEGWNGLGTITEVSKDEFKKWIESSHRKTKPFSEYKSVRANEMQTTDESELRYRVVSDQNTLNRLNSEPTIKVYRAMQLIDGKLYPPMSAKVDGELRQPIELGQWEEAEERPDLVDEKGRFKLDKGNKSSLKARYNPYFHTSPTPLNDQFSSAQTRPELVTVEVEVPESELTSGYKAEKAKDSVGKMEWKAGVVQSKLSGTRTVILSRWDKPVRIVPDSEVADVIVDMFEGRDITMPSNVVTPSLRAELEKRGVPFVETDNQGNAVEEVSSRVTGTPTDEVVANGLQLTPAQTAEVAANIFAALPEESRKKITKGLNGNILGLKDAILQIPTSLASKENWNEDDKQMADLVAEEMTKMAGEMTRPFSASEGLWLLYNNLNKGTDLISQASRALIQRNLGFDTETLARQEQAKENVRFRTVGDATSNARANLYNRGAVNVWTRLKESYVDMMASVEELVKAIEKRTGKVAQGFENILLALNQQSSRGLAAMESYTQKFLNPMFDEIRRIMDETKMKYEDIVRYVILKHGLERNKKLAQRDARAHYQEIYDDIISKINSMDDRQKRTYLTNAQLKEADAKAKLATLQAKDTTSFTDDELKAHKKGLAEARKAVKEATEFRERAEKIRNMSEQEAQDELDKIFEKIENGTDSVYKEMRENDYSGISSMFYDQLGVDRKNFSTEEQYQAALMEAKKDRYSSLKDVEAAAEAEVKGFEGKTDTKELWKRINAATKETLRQQYETNMISKDQYDSLRNMFEYYVPLRGFKDNTAEDMYTYYRKPNSTGYTKPILGAEGRKTEAESPFGWIAAMAGSAIASNVKNEAKLALYYFVSNRQDNGIATISKTWFVDSGEVDERGKKIFKPAYPPFSEDLSSDAAKASYEAWQENMRELQKKGQAYEAGQRLNLGNAVVNISDANKPEHIVNVKVGGKDYTIIINGNPRAAQAINGDLNIEGTSQDYSALFGPVLRWMSSVNTSYNPEFWVTNMMRDMAFTMMAINIKEDPAYRRKFSKNYQKAFKVISLVAKNEKGTIGDSYLEQQYKDFVKYGGVTGYTQIKDSETWEQEINNYLSSNDPESIKNGKVMRGVKSAFHAAHRFGESLEQVSRFAAFLTARETGKSINEAINDAKEITVNFNRKGSGKMITLEEAKYLTGKNGQPLTKIQQWMAVGASSIAPLGRRTIIFFNAAIQGLNATYKLMKKNPKRFTGWALGYAAVGMMNAVLHAMLDDDDDYLDIPQYERRNSLMIGGNGAYFKWALPQEARAFYALGDLAVETVMGRNPHQNVLGEALKIGTEILPVNPSEGWKAFMPSVAIPFIELALNEDYKGAPIYNNQKWLSEEEKERTAKWSSAYQGTGWTYVKIAQGLNFITGGDKHDAGLINLQPEKLEHLVQSAFGGTIRTADKFINTISAAIDPEEPMTVRQTPFLNRFLTINDERFKNVHVNDVFDYYKADAEHALTLEKQYIKDRDVDALTKLRSSDEYQWAKIYAKYKKPLEAIREKVKVADGTAEKKELMKQQDELKKRMIKEISEL